MDALADQTLTPRGGLVLDPFTGSGSTSAAAVFEGARFLGIEREASYAPIARARIAYWSGQADARKPKAVRRRAYVHPVVGPRPRGGRGVMSEQQEPEVGDREQHSPTRSAGHDRPFEGVDRDQQQSRGQRLGDEDRRRRRRGYSPAP